MTDGFQRVLDHIRSVADTQAAKGRLFERLIKTYFEQDTLYRERFSEVWLWSQWAAARQDFDGSDTYDLQVMSPLKLEPFPKPNRRRYSPRFGQQTL